MPNIKLNILGLSYSQTQENAYVLILIEEGGERRIPIIIGGSEAQAIAIQLENLKAPRPLTHDLFLTFAQAFDITLKEVVIFKLQEGIFYSKIVCKQGDIEVEIDSRTSDAVALAVRFNCPIFTTEDVISKAGIILDIEKEIKNDPNESFDMGEDDLGEYTDEELQTMLDEAIGNEDYERASLIRDELQNRTEEDTEL